MSSEVRISRAQAQQHYSDLLAAIGAGTSGTERSGARRAKRQSRRWGRRTS